MHKFQPRKEVFFQEMQHKNAQQPGLLCWLVWSSS